MVYIIKPPAPAAPGTVPMLPVQPRQAATLSAILFLILFAALSAILLNCQFQSSIRSSQPPVPSLVPPFVPPSVHHIPVGRELPAVPYGHDLFRSSRPVISVRNPYVTSSSHPPTHPPGCCTRPDCYLIPPLPSSPKKRSRTALVRFRLLSRADITFRG